MSPETEEQFRAVLYVLAACMVLYIVKTIAQLIGAMP